MLSLDDWSAIGIVCGSILALATLVNLTAKGTRRMLKAFRKFGTLMDQLLGDEKNPSLMEVLEDTRATGADTRARVERVEAAQAQLKQGLERVEASQAEHLQSHGGPAPVPISRGRRR